MKSFSVAVISSRDELRTKLSDVLRRDVRELSVFTDPDEASREATKQRGQVLVLDLSAAERPMDELQHVTAWARGTRLVLVVPRDFDLGVFANNEQIRAILPEDVSPITVGHTVRLVANDLTVRPVRKPAMPPTASGERLSPREQEVLMRVALGESNKAVSQALSLSDHTVRVHMRSILRKLGLRNRTQAALWANANSELLSARRP